MQFDYSMTVTVTMTMVVTLGFNVKKFGYQYVIVSRDCGSTFYIEICVRCSVLRVEMLPPPPPSPPPPCSEFEYTSSDLRKSRVYEFRPEQNSWVRVSTRAKLVCTSFFLSKSRVYEFRPERVRVSACAKLVWTSFDLSKTRVYEFRPERVRVSA